MAYVELSTIKKTLELSAETYADDDLRIAIESASTAVDSACGRKFLLDEEDTARTYEAQRPDWIEIHDLAALTSIESDTYGNSEWTTWEDGSYELQPLNAIADGEPYRSIKLTPYSSVSRFLPPDTRIRVTGRFGWPEIPPSLQEATTLIATRLLKRAREAPFGIAGIGGDGIAVRISSFDPDVRMLLSPYARPVRLV